MDIISLITFAGGLAFFLYGMNVLSSGLERLAGGKLEEILKKLTSNRFMGLLAGAGITVAVQSSSAVTVMLVGLASSGMIMPADTVSIIMGSNVGTTLTPWLLATVGMKAESTFGAILKPENFSLALSLIGAAMLSFSKKRKTKDAGGILVGFGILMTGMKFMSTGASPIASSPEVSRLMVSFENPLLAVAVGTLFTALIQSSAASIGILQAVSITGSLTCSAAIPVIVGQNIGTCVTSVLSCVGVPRKAKKVTVIHVLFNVVGGAFFLTAYYILKKTGAFSFFDTQVSSFGIALIHTIFNLSVTLVLFPLSGLIVKLCDRLLPEDNSNEERAVIPDDRLLVAPFAASAECFGAVVRMAHLSEKAILMSLENMFSGDNGNNNVIESLEKEIDRYEDGLATFALKLSKVTVSENDMTRVTGILHVITDLERLGDHASGLSKVSAELREKNVEFSEKTLSELQIVSNALTEIMTLSLGAYCENDVEKAGKTEPLKDVIHALVTSLRDHHIGRLRKGLTTLEKGFILSDILIHFERIADHCSNIAAVVISQEHGDFSSHSFLSRLRASDSSYASLLSHYEKKYLSDIEKCK